LAGKLRFNLTSYRPIHPWTFVYQYKVPLVSVITSLNYATIIVPCGLWYRALCNFNSPLHPSGVANWVPA